MNFHLSLRNPWYTENFANLFNKSGRITKNKSWEIEIIKYSYTLAEISVNWNFRTDHAGLEVIIGFLGYACGGSIRDNRHWDRKNKCWAK